MGNERKSDFKCFKKHLFRCVLPPFQSITIKQNRIDYFVKPRGSWFCIPPKTNYSSQIIMENVGQLRAAETRSTASERNGGGAAGKVSRRRMRRSAPALCIAPLPPPLLFFFFFFSESHSCAGVRARCGASLHRHGGHTITEPGTGKRKKAWNSAEGKNGALFFWNHRNLWEIKQEPDIY